MALVDQIAGGVGRAATLLRAGGLLPTLQWHERDSERTETGQAKYRDPVSVEGVVEDADARTLERYGIQTPARAQVTLLGSWDVKANDKITLPDGRTLGVVAVPPMPVAADGTRFLTVAILG